MAFNQTIKNVAEIFETKCGQKDYRQIICLVIDVTLEQHGNYLRGDYFAGIKENHFGNSGNRGEETAARVEKSDNLFDDDKAVGKIAAAVVIQYINTFGGKTRGYNIKRRSC
ncbi:unnamed protein product [Colias eurytheme]|nr:unnamed protein product [Colias eurytheme]